MLLIPSIMEIEITHPLKLSEIEESLIPMHSVSNIMSVLTGELNLLCMDFGDYEILRPAVRLIVETAKSLSDTVKTHERIERYDEYEIFILDSVEAALKKYPQFRNMPETQRCVVNIQSILKILKVRIEEIIARRENPMQWETFSINMLKENFITVLSVIEKNGKGRYGIVYNKAMQGISDYLITLRIESVDGDVITLPSVLQDVVRDLVANARKYTLPGGNISAELVDDGKEIRLVVEDNGCGIPPNEIEQVINFGVRASNVTTLKTKGGGFGITKAYYVTKQFGGRMWIQSEISEANHGTRITIVLPNKK